MTWRFDRSSLSAALAICGLAAGLATVTPSQLLADENDCSRSVARYDAALNNLQGAVARFSSCTATSAGRTKCSREFDHLNSANDDYKDAVSNYRGDCK